MELPPGVSTPPFLHQSRLKWLGKVILTSTLTCQWIHQMLRKAKHFWSSHLASSLGYTARLTTTLQRQLKR